MNWKFSKLQFDDLKENVDGNSESHFYMGRKFRLYGLQNNNLPFPLLYSALEFRLCIERLTFEIYIMLSRAKLIKDGLSEKELKRVDSKFSSMVSVITEHAGNSKMFRKYFICCQYHVSIFDSINARPSIPNLNIFKSLWHELSQYLHFTLYPEKTWGNKIWINQGYELLKRTEDYVASLMFGKNAIGTVHIDSVADEIKDLIYKFINDEINEDQLKTRMIIMKPIISLRQLPSGRNRLIF